MVFVRPGRWGAGMVAALILSCTPGCAFYVAPGLWTRGGGTVSSAPPPLMSQNPPIPAMSQASNPMMPPPNLGDAIRSSYAIPPGPGNNPQMPLGSPHELVSLLHNRSMKSEEQLQALHLRVGFLENKLKTENGLVLQAGHEVEQTSAEAKKARTELTRLKTDLEELRTKLATMQRENFTAFTSIVGVLEGLREQRSPKLPAMNLQP